MNTQGLLTFLKVAETKNFTQASKDLFISQSTVTNRIIELEREIGKPLFLRNNKLVTLTNEGKLFISYAKRMVELEEQSIKDINSFFYPNTLRIGSTSTIYESHLYPLISTLMKSSKDLSLKITLGHTNELIHMMQDELLDIAFTYQPFSKTGLTCIPCFQDDLVLVASPSINQYKKGVHRSDLIHINYLMCNFALQEVGTYIRELFPEYYQFSFEIDNSTKLLSYLRDGFGYSFVPLGLIEDDIKKGTLNVIPLLDFKTPQIQSYCIYKKDNVLCEKLLQQQFEV